LITALSLMPAFTFAAGEEGPRSVKGSTTASSTASWEVWTGSLLDYTWYNPGVPGASTDSFFDIAGNPTSLKPSVGYIIGDSGLEIKVSPSYILTSIGGTNGVTAGNFLLLGGLNYSFSFQGQNFQNSWFIEFLAGANRASNGQTAATTFAWSAGLGRRIQLTDSITWNPEFEVLGISSDVSGYSTAMFYSIIPVQFGLFF